MECFFLHSHQSGMPQLLPLLTFDYGDRIPDTKKHLTVISWGEAAQMDTGSNATLHYFNDVLSVLQTKNKKKMRQTLMLHGLKVKPLEGNPVFRIDFQIPVFHLTALTVFSKINSTKLWSALPYYQSNADSYEELDLSSRVGFHVRRAVREARKAVYALGLDFALVHIGILGMGDTVVIDVEPAPALNQRLAQCYADAMNRFALELKAPEQMKLIQPKRIMMGADPEFILRKPNGKIVSADRFMGRVGDVGCDAVVLSGHRVILPLVELRPQPSSNPIILTRHLQSLMVQADRLINHPELDWLAGSMPIKGLPLGGHIHFSGVEVTSRLLRVLDNYLALPLVMIEGETANRRRPRYGFLGDFRHQPHGGFEYRSLPSWLISPEIAAGVLTLGFVIAHHYLDLNQRPLKQSDVQRAFYEGDKNLLEPIAEKLYQDIKRTSMYKKYQKELDLLFLMILSREVWQEQQDFRRKWGIKP
jgi:hypothetical protein